jgi:tetratricopeptide (TPR) repeat protein
MSRNTALRVLSLARSSGVELNAYLVADSKPTRQEQKLKTLSEYVQQYPSGWKKRLELANLLSEMGQIEQAVEEYRQVIDRQQPPSIGVQLQLAKLLQLMGQEVEAIAVYESASANARNEATRQHISGSIALCRNDTPGAILAFESAASLEPHNAAHWLALAQVQVGRGDAVAALRAFDAVLSLHPEDIVASIGSYDALVAVGNVRQAQQRLSKVLEVAPGDFGVLKRLADTRCRMRLVSGEEGKQTKKTIASVLQLAPEAADGHELLAYYHFFRGESANGVAVLEGFTEEHPNHPRSWYSYGRYLFHTGEYQRAAEAMLKAYRLYPQDCEIYRALCEILPAAGMTSSPVSLDPLVKGDLGRSNREVTLASIVEEMLDRFPDRWSAWTTAGRVLVENFQEIDRGCSLSAKGTQLEPQLPDAWFCHGRVLALAFKHREAVEALAQGWAVVTGRWGLSAIYVCCGVAGGELSRPGG